MNKEYFLVIIFFLVYLMVFAQTDTIPVNTSDTIIKSQFTSVSVNNSGNILSEGNKEQVYKLKPAIDIPIIAVGTAWSVYAFTKIYNKTPPTVEQIEALKKSDINAFDRWAVYPFSQKLDDISYYPFYASIPLPLIYFLGDNATRSDFFKLSFLYWEAMSITGLLGTNATYHVDRYRPYTYTSETDMDKKTGSVAKNSFYAGHVQVVATPTFFIAKVYADYHPDSKIKWVFYGIASTATAATAYMRLRGGQHFPTDILLGTITGALAGILVPQYHKTKTSKDPALSIMPFSSGDINGLVFTYKIKK